MTDTQIRARGRPRSFDDEAGVAIASQMFWERGYDSVGIAELCKAIDISPTSLYAAYGNKAGLYERVLDAYQAHSRERLFAGFDEARGLDEAVAVLLGNAAAAYTADPDRLGCPVLDGVLMTDDPDVRAALRARAERTARRLAERLSAFGANDPKSAADYLGVVLRGLSAAARTGKTTAELTRCAQIASAGFAATHGGRQPAADST
ncbi:MAG: TetR/AcrR family transcriptional regulator [Pseudomonadota bacterium]